MTARIQYEWQYERHASVWSSYWLADMHMREQYEWLDNTDDGDLRRQIVEREGTKEDVHLLEAALPTDRIVTSCDCAARARFRRCASSVPRIREVMWADPTHQVDGAVEWLERGAPEEPHRMLGYAEGPQ